MSVWGGGKGDDFRFTESAITRFLGLGFARDPLEGSVG